MPAFGSGTPLDQSSATLRYPLGQRLTIVDGEGEKEFVYIQNTSAATLAVGAMAVRDGTEDWGVQACATSTSYNPVSVFGFAQIEIPADHYGFVQRKGYGLVRAGSTAITAGQLVVPTTGSAAGTVTSSATQTSLAVGVVMATATSATARAQINLP